MTTVESSRIHAFIQAAAEDPQRALEALRADLEAARGPLVESIDGEALDVVVTFVWIGSDGPVSISTPLLAGIPVSTPLERVDGTDVWHLSLRVRSDVSTTYQFSVDDPLLGRDAARVLDDPKEMTRLMAESAAHAYADPFNPDRLPRGGDVPKERWQTILTLPGAEPMHWYDGPADASGSIEAHQFTSATLGNERTVTVYMPPDYRQDGDSYPLVVMLDGEMWTGEAGPQYVAFDNLLAAGRIPPVVVAFVNNPPSDLPLGATRAFEMDCNPAYPVMLGDELVPMLRARYNVATDPSRVVIAGPSFGGLAAAYIGFERPEVFGNVLACSPAVWWGYAGDGERFLFDEDGYPIWLGGRHEEPEWLTRQYAAAERKPLRFWVDVGCLEVAPMMAVPVGGLDYRAAVRHLRTVLIAKGYDVTYYEAAGGHEWPTFRRSYAKGLETLLGPLR